MPFGTAYEYYITQEQYESLSEGNRANLLLRALVLRHRLNGNRWFKTVSAV